MAFCVNCGNPVSDGTLLCRRCEGGSAGPTEVTGEVRIVSLPSVVVRDIDMPFSSMVSFMVKWALAAIPALAIMSAIAAFVFVLITGALSE